MNIFNCSRLLSLACIALLAVFFGCDSSGDGGGDANIEAITSEGSAEFVVEDLSEGVAYNCVVSEIDHGTHSGTVVAGGSGTAAVTGDSTYTSGISCGSDCVRSETDTDLTIVYNNFTCMTADNTEATISGTVTYTDNTWSSQSGFSYSSGGSVAIEGSNVAYRVVDVDGSWGYSDTITFSATGNSAAYLSGWCQPSNGTVYSF